MIRDALQSMTAVSWPEAALVLFLTAFVLVTAYVFVFRRRDQLEPLRNLPLENESRLDPNHGDAS